MSRAEVTSLTDENAALAYVRRFGRVLEHVEAHPEENSSVERLSGIAAFSKHHFHRQFAELFGLSVYTYVQLVRLKRASYELSFRKEKRIIDVALSCGYDSHEAFSRAFKRHGGQTPSEFRERPDWGPWQDIHRRLVELRSQHMSKTHRPEDVKIVTFPETPVAVLEHRGDPRLLMSTIRTFIEWRKENGLSPKRSATFNIAYDDLDVPAESYRFDLCAATERPVEKNAQGVIEKVIPGGRCAVLRHVGSDDTLRASVGYLYAEWLPQSGEEPRDFPLFFQRVRFFPDVSESEAITDIFLPLG